MQMRLCCSQHLRQWQVQQQSEMEGAGKAAGGTAQAGMTELATDSDVAMLASSGSSAEPTIGGITAAVEEESASVGSPLACAGEACCGTGSGSGCCGEEGGCGCSCSTLPRLRRLEAEQVRGVAECTSALTHIGAAVCMLQYV